MPSVTRSYYGHEYLDTTPERDATPALEAAISDYVASMYKQYGSDAVGKVIEHTFDCIVASFKDAKLQQ